MRAIVYDLDGTLVDSSGNITAAVNRVRRAYGLTDISVQQCLPYIGNGAEDLVARAVFGKVDETMRAPDDVLDLAEYDFASVYQRFYDGYVAHPADGHTVFPGVLEALSEFSSLGISQAVLTNKPHGVTLLVLDALGLTSYFSSVLGAHAPLSEGQMLPPKPDPTGMLLTLAILEVDANEAVMVGDGVPDIMVANRVGLRSIAISGGFAEAELLQRYNPTWQVDTFKDASFQLRKVMEESRD